VVARVFGALVSTALLACGGGLVGAQEGGGSDGTGATGSPDGSGATSPGSATMSTTATGMDGTVGAESGPGVDATDGGESEATSSAASGPAESDSDGGSDTGAAMTWCADEDGDAAGDPAQCSGADPGGWVPNADDCDDADPNVALCPKACGTLGPNVSCSADLETFLDEHTEPACPTSDLLHDVPAGPGEWAIRTAGAINGQWPGHGIYDHTLGTEGGRVFYSDLQTAVPGVAYWREVLDVEPDTEYVFEAWVKDTATEDPDHTGVVIGVRVDGTPVISGFALPDLQGDYATYEPISFGFHTSGSGTVTLEIVNDQMAGPSAGIDVAIDDVVVSTCAR
jgi:hypothetical protein